MTHNKKLMQLPIHNIYTPPKRIRATSPPAVDALAQSIAERGLDNAIHVVKTTDGFILVTGMHRFKACIKLGWEEIDAVVWDEGTPAEELLITEIDENLTQGTLTACEFIESLYIRKTNYEKMHPETVNGVNQHTRDSKIGNPQYDDYEPLKCFTLHIAKLTGVSKSKIYSGLSAYPILEPIWHLVKISSIKDQFTQITSLATATDSKGKYADEEYRLKLLELINDTDLSMVNKVKDAMNQLKGKVFDSPKDKNIFAFESRWENAPTEYKKAVYESHAQQIISDLKELGYL